MAGLPFAAAASGASAVLSPYPVQARVDRAAGAAAMASILASTCLRFIVLYSSTAARRIAAQPLELELQNAIAGAHTRAGNHVLRVGEREPAIAPGERFHPVRAAQPNPQRGGDEQQESECDMGECGKGTPPQRDAVFADMGDEDEQQQG